LIYLICAPQNKLDKRNRVSGWRVVPLERKAKLEWRAMLEPLKGKVSNVYAADIDQEAAHAAGDELHVPVRAEYHFRRFNVGRWHAKPANVLDAELRRVEERWRENPDIPIKEGDSLTSYRKRFVENFKKLLDRDGDCLFVTDQRSIAVIRDGFNAHSLIPNGNPVNVKKIFIVKKNA
jgi:broad specificity phosphatase PhoE